MKRKDLCDFDGCQDAPVPGSHWCEHHRRLLRQVGGAEPDPLHALIVSATDAHYVLTVEEIAARLGCAVEDVREHLKALRCAGRARPWLPGVMQVRGVTA